MRKEKRDFFFATHVLLCVFFNYLLCSHAQIEKQGWGGGGGGRKEKRERKRGKRKEKREREGRKEVRERERERERDDFMREVKSDQRN